MRTYDSYKDSGIEWIGKIPRHWLCVKPQFLFRPSNRSPHENDEIVTCFRDGVVTLRKNRREDGFTTSLKEIGYQRILVGDLVIHEMDGFEGSIGVSDSIGKSTPVYTVISESESHNNRYWMYLLREMSNTRFIQSLSKSIRERTTEFRWNMWKNQLFPLPPLSEQEQIVSYLDEKTSLIDEMVEKKKRKIELLKEYRTSLINTVVTKGLNPDVPKKDSGIEWIGEIPRHWVVGKLGFYTSKIGSGLTPKGGSEIYSESGIPFIRSQNVHFQGLVLDNVSYIDIDIHNSMSGSKVSYNDVLLNITGGSIGRCCVVQVNQEMNVNQHVCIIRTNNKLSPYYLNYLLSSTIGQSQVTYNISGGNREGLTVDGIKDIIIDLPPFSEQEQIVSYLDEKTGEIDKTIELENKKIELLKEYRQSLISNVVTGKIKVTIQ